MNNTNEYILSQLKSPTHYRERYNISWFLDKMTYEEICSLDSTLSGLSWSSDEESDYDWDAINSIIRHIKKLKAHHSGGNKTLTVLIAELKDTNSIEIADELFDRFEYQSHNDQKRILKALLNSEHRGLAYQLLDDEWAKIFLTTLQRNWLKHEDLSAIKYIIKLSSEEFLFKHIDKLANEWFFYYNLLCIRLGNNPRFVVNENYLTQKWEYYIVMCVLGRGIERKDILAEVFSYVKSALLEASNTFSDISLSIWSNDDYISAELIPEVENALRNMREAEFNEELEFFYRWDSDIRSKLKEAESELANRGKKCDNIRDKWSLYCKIAKENFPDFSLFYPQSTKCSEDVIEKLQPIIEEFGLELDDDPFENFPAPRLKAPYSEADIYPWYNGVPF